jgi:hypothetical protein
MLRWVFRIASVTSLLLCIGTGMIWFRSYWVCDGFIVRFRGTASIGRSVKGHVTILRVYGIAETNGFTRIYWTNLVDYDQKAFAAPGAWEGGRGFQDVDFHLLGLAVVGGSQTYVFKRDPTAFVDYACRLIVIPYWMPCLLAVWPLCPLMISGLKRIPFRHPLGTCRRCGYDLRVSKERCPECGTAIPSEPIEAEA